MTTMKKCVAEFLGTMFLVLFGCGTAIMLGCDYSMSTGYILTALAFGGVMTATAYALGPVSGAHINPAVSLAMLMTGRMKGKDFILYVLSQIVGAIAGAACLGIIFGFQCGFGTNSLCINNIPLTIFIEIILTFVFVLVVLMVTAKKETGAVAGLAIGLALFLVHIFGIELTGTSVNPARSLGPAIFAGGSALKIVWVFIVAPLLGAVVASAVYMYFAPDKAQKADVKKAPKKVEKTNPVIEDKDDDVSGEVSELESFDMSEETNEETKEEVVDVEEPVEAEEPKTEEGAPAQESAAQDVVSVEAKRIYEDEEVVAPAKNASANNGTSPKKQNGSNRPRNYNNNRQRSRNNNNRNYQRNNSRNNGSKEGAKA